MNIEFDNHGNFKINDTIISRKLTQLGFENLFSNFPFSKFQIKKTILYKIQTDEVWLGYLVESISAEFVSDQCSKISLSLVGSEEQSILSVLDLRVSRYIQTMLCETGKTNGKSQLVFKLEYFTVIIIYDYKISCPTLEILFN